MKRTREQIKAELMKQAEQEIDRLLDWEEKADKPTLTQFENQVLITRKALSEAMLEGVMAGQESRQPAEPVVSKVWAADREQRSANERDRDASGDVAAETPVSLLCPLSSGFFPPWMSSCRSGRPIGAKESPAWWCG